MTATWRKPFVPAHRRKRDPLRRQVLGTLRPHVCDERCTHAAAKEAGK